MRLVRFGNRNNERPGVEVRGKRYDCSAFFEDWNHDFFQNHGLAKLKKIVNNEIEKLPEVKNGVRWGSPIARPGMILCVGLNYSDHAKESGLAIPNEPILFMKATNTISGPFDNVTIPKNSHKTDWEVELGIVIGRNILYLKNEEEAERSIAGYCVVNDLSEREFQIEKNGQWVKGKSCPGFSPLGPYLVTRDEVVHVSNLNMTLSVNNIMRQNGSTSTMIFKPNFLIYYISQFMQLEAGDIISTGTPPGVGLGMKPPTYLKAGDEVSLEIEGLGRQVQVMRAYKE